MGQYLVHQQVTSSKCLDQALPELVYVCHANEEHTTLPRTMHMHKQMLEIVFIKKGNGRHLIGNNIYDVKQGDILIYNSHVLHDEYMDQTSKMSVYCVGMKNVKCSGLPENHLIPESMSCVWNCGDQAHQIETLLEMILFQVKTNQAGHQETCSYLLSALISLLLTIPKEQPLITEEVCCSLFLKIKSYIDLHYAENITLSSIAKELNASPYYIAHLFKKHTGFSPIQYIIRRRIGESQSLLINTNFTVTQIAGMTGYDNPNYFTSLFTKLIGISPKKYRHLWRGV